MSNQSESLVPLLGPLCALGSSVSWALASTIYAQTATVVGPTRTNLLRCLCALPLFIGAALLFCGPAAMVAIPLPQLGWLVLSTVCSYALGDLLFYMAAQRLGTPTALAIGSIYPLWATAFGVLSLGEKVGPLRGAGTLACMAGVAWLVRLQDRGSSTAAHHRSRRSLLPGVGLALLTSLFWAGNSYSIRRGSVGISFLVANSLRFALSAAALGMVDRLASRRGPPATPPVALPRRFYLASVLEGFGGSSIFVYGLAHSDLSVAAPLSSLAPLFAVPIGLILGTEALNIRRLLAIVLTVAGLLLLMR